MRPFTRSDSKRYYLRATKEVMQTWLSELFPWGSEAKPTPAARGDLGVLFDFQHSKKSLTYRNGYIHGFASLP